MKKQTKRKKLRNGFGTICQNKRRSQTDTPFTVYENARIVIDKKSSKEKITRKTLGHFKTYEDAYAFLIEFHKNPQEYDNKNITFGTLFKELEKEWFPKLSKNSLEQYKSTYKKLKSIYNTPIIKLKTKELQEIINPYLENTGVKKNIKTILNKVFEYAEKYDVINKNYTKFIDMGRTIPPKQRIIYSQEEIKRLWGLTDYDCVKIVLIMIYTGTRIGEIRTILKENVHLNDSYMTGGIKTIAGKNRIIPLCEKIKPLIYDLINNENNNTNTIVNSSKEQDYFNMWLRKEMKQLGFDHKSHDCRHTFASNMRDLSVPYEITETIMGHKCRSLLLDTYTHIKKEKLIEAVNLL